MFAMTGALMGGNDLLDNLAYSRRETSSTPPGEPKTCEEVDADCLAKRGWLIDLRHDTLKHSNLVRFAYFYLGPWIRAALSPEPDGYQLSEALAATRAQLVRLHAMSRAHEFDYEIYVLHPVQDLLRGTFRQTIESVQDLAPSGNVTGTAFLFHEEPGAYYFSYDGTPESTGQRPLCPLSC